MFLKLFKNILKPKNVLRIKNVFKNFFYIIATRAVNSLSGMIQ